MASYQSLYRRYRPQRFDEVLGQDHVSRALRNAVREGRVGHAYLFSGPRGTGKTSTARILAKVLNCAAPADGEPCGECKSCVAVAEGRVIDWLLEQDAASKSKVDDMRDLLERVPLGTSGNRKVIILDEVHMLSQGAENALLKTLEEPPEHVVFVLATTDPQKVRPTIRSRTQHFEFRLLSPDVMADHVRHVIGDAGLGLDDAAIDHVVRSGGGSARDALSALDQVAALGEVVDLLQPVDAVIDALCARDAGVVLVAVAEALASGRDPRTLGEGLIASLRNAFLAVMGVGDAHLAPADRERAALVGERLGAAGLTRALDVLGEALTELARKPDPRVVVEVALVRLTRADTDRTLDAVLERLDRLERGISAATAPAGADGPPRGSGGSRASQPGQAAAPDSAGHGPGASAGADRRGGGSAGRGAKPPGSSKTGAAAAARAALAATRSADTDDPASETAASPETGAAGGKPTLGAVARRSRRRGGAGAPGGPEPAGTSGMAGDVPAGDVPAGDAGTGGAAGQSASAAGSAAGTAGAGGGEGASRVDARALVAVWDGQILAHLPIPVRSKWRGGRWVDPAGDTLRFAVPNEWHQKACEDTRREVEEALAAHFGARVPVAVVVDADASAAPGRPGAPRGRSGSADLAPAAGASGDGYPPDEHEHIDPSELRDAGDIATGGVDLLMREFGGQLVEEER